MISLPILTENMKFFHGAFLTPQKLEDEKVFKNVGMQRGAKNVKRVFFTDKMGTK